MTIRLDDLYRARARIASYVRPTPLRRSKALCDRLGRAVRLKMETMHDTGAFKLRGAANKLLSLSAAERRRGVITVSSGNHGKAVAHMARQLGLRAVVCLTRLVPPEKVAGLRAYGAEVVIHGADQDAADAKARALAERDGLVFVSPFDDPLVIAGQGTLGLELAEQCPELETLLVQLSGGGLMSGIAIALKALRPGVRLIGVSTVHGAAMHESVRAGRIVPVDEKPSVADALPGPIPPDNAHTFDLCRRLVDDFVQVEDAAIETAMSYILHHEKCLVEGAAAAGVAHLLTRGGDVPGRTVAAILTGDNIAADRALGICAGAADGWRTGSNADRTTRPSPPRVVERRGFGKGDAPLDPNRSGG